MIHLLVESKVVSDNSSNVDGSGSGASSGPSKAVEKLQKKIAALRKKRDSQKSLKGSANTPSTPGGSGPTKPLEDMTAEERAEYEATKVTTETGARGFNKENYNVDENNPDAVKSFNAYKK